MHDIGLHSDFMSQLIVLVRRPVDALEPVYIYPEFDPFSYQFNYPMFHLFFPLSPGNIVLQISLSATIAANNGTAQDCANPHHHAHFDLMQIFPLCVRSGQNLYLLLSFGFIPASLLSRKPRLTCFLHIHEVVYRYLRHWFICKHLIYCPMVKFLGYFKSIEMSP